MRYHEFTIRFDAMNKTEAKDLAEEARNYLQRKHAVFAEVVKVEDVHDKEDLNDSL